MFGFGRVDLRWVGFTIHALRRRRHSPQSAMI
jgi:hypothetical protein